LGLFSGASWGAPARVLAAAAVVGLPSCSPSSSVCVAAMAATFSGPACASRYACSCSFDRPLLPLAFSVTEFRTLECPPNPPLCRRHCTGGHYLIRRVRLLLFAVLASFASRPLPPFTSSFCSPPLSSHRVALWDADPSRNGCLLPGFPHSVCLVPRRRSCSCCEHTRAFRHTLRHSRCWRLFTMAVRKLRRMHVSARCRQRTSPYGPDSRCVLTITVWSRRLSLVCRCPQSRDTLPRPFSHFCPGERISHHRGAEGLRPVCVSETLAYCCAVRPQHLSPEEARCACHDRCGGHHGRTSDRPARQFFSSAPSFFAAGTAACFAIGVTVSRHCGAIPGGKSMHFICRKATNRSALYAEDTPTQNCSLRCTASCRHPFWHCRFPCPNLFGKPAFPSNPISLSCLLKAPHAAAARTKGLVAVVPVDRLRTAIVVREERSFVDWPHAVICRTGTWPAITPRDVSDAARIHRAAYWVVVAIGTLDSPPSDSRLRGEEHFDRPSWRCQNARRSSSRRHTHQRSTSPFQFALPDAASPTSSAALA